MEEARTRSSKLNHRVDALRKRRHRFATRYFHTTITLVRRTSSWLAPRDAHRVTGTVLVLGFLDLRVAPTCMRLGIAPGVASAGSRQHAEIYLALRATDPVLDGP